MIDIDKVNLDELDLTSLPEDIRKLDGDLKIVAEPVY